MFDDRKTLEYSRRQTQAMEDMAKAANRLATVWERIFNAWQTVDTEPGLRVVDWSDILTRTDPDKSDEN